MKKILNLIFSSFPTDFTQFSKIIFFKNSFDQKQVEWRNWMKNIQYKIPLKSHLKKIEFRKPFFYVNRVFNYNIIFIFCNNVGTIFI